MKQKEKQKYIIYLGDFDLRNQNAQAHLVKNNAKILNNLGYKVAFIGVNRESKSTEIDSLPKIDSLGEGNLYLELENTLSLSGLLKYPKIEKRIISFIEDVSQESRVEFVISYQSPTFALILKRVIKWCKDNGAHYLVNCADITLFNSQPFFRRIAMIANWHYLHKVNRDNADGIIAVSSYIDRFYYKKGRPSIIIPPLFDEIVDFDYNLEDITTFVHAGYPFAPIKRKLTAENMKDRLDLIVDWFIELSNRHIPYKFIIIGLSKETYCENIPWQKKQLEIIPEIVFKGRLLHSETLELVKNSDYMITYRDKNPMTEAGLPTKVVESVSLGTPVIMNDVGDTLNYLKEGISGYKIAEDKAHNLDLLTRLCGNKPMEDRLSSKLNCARLGTFRIESFQLIMDSFLKNVKNYHRNSL